ncbi:MAG: acetyl-CoA carboxylase biotin carboxylase subunit, partial [Chloroflexota bacterium]|nr:acetyl-CoA carboxylase biotin carboxylase subunit [Chloroflexota bacterium]
MFDKILVANRGEIAVRVIRACRELGVRSVVAYSEADRESLAVRMADESVCIGPAPSSKSYLNIPSVMSAALITGCDAVHPGYGFLSENTYLVEICDRLGISFIGPPRGVVERMSDKASARQAMREAGVPVVPGIEEPLTSTDRAARVAREIGYPVLLKAVAGGGGRGMRVVRGPEELEHVFAVASAEAEAAFSDGRMYLEKFLDRPRHIEVQVIGDRQGRIIELGERDCSIQRRQQKLIEESPAPQLSGKVRDAIRRAALRGARHLHFDNVGTFEFLLEGPERFYFVEMNTRIQVEHTVTEMVTGLDLVKWQIRLASDERLTLEQKDVRHAGHALECRITAEDYERDFTPQTGTVDVYLPPGGPGVRVDSHLYSGYSVPPYYDSLLA